MPSLNLDLAWFGHRKAVRLVGILGHGADLLPIKLWVYAGIHHPENGRLTGYLAQEIEHIVGWKGEPGKFVEAMMHPAINLLEQREDFFQIHDWLDHCGHLASFKKRAITAAKKRWSRYASSNRELKSSNALQRGNVTYRKERKGKELEGECRGETAKRKTSSPYPENFELSESLKAWVVEQRCPDVGAQLEAFRDYHVSKGSRFIDWDAAFRTWIRNSFKFGKVRPIDSARGPKTKADEMRERQERALQQGLSLEER